jgi:hydrogenase 3 maturation protease
MKRRLRTRQKSKTRTPKRLHRTIQNLLGQLGELNPAETVIVGIGNVLKGDDGAGPKVCSILKDKITAEVIDVGTTLENYIGRIVRMSPKKLLIIDAIDFGKLPGAIRVFRTQDLKQLAFSTHCLSPHLFVQNITSQIDAEIFFIGIQPAHLQLGRGLSRQIADAIAALADEIKSALCHKSCNGSVVI